jgi:hypothetical protein
MNSDGTVNFEDSKNKPSKTVLGQVQMSAGGWVRMRDQCPVGHLSNDPYRLTSARALSGVDVEHPLEARHPGQRACDSGGLLGGPVSL